VQEEYIGHRGRIVHMARPEPELVDEIELREMLRQAYSGTPRMFATLVLAFREEFGDKALEVAQKAMYEYGYKAGKEDRARAKDAGLKEYFRVHVLEGLLRSPATDVAVDEISDTKLVYHCPPGQCPNRIPMVWQEMGLDDETVKLLGEIYCKTADPANREAFNPKIHYEQRLWQPQGDPVCEMYHTLEPDEDE
jgi:hypothetical protein